MSFSTSSVICDVGTVTLSASGASNYTWTGSDGSTYNSNVHSCKSNSKTQPTLYKVVRVYVQVILKQLILPYPK
ncbi:MAG: hypothetical protein KatS3mg027_1473 [Bacteroidia bacterium]|nr:MAG: hypothetical protein KatS3mg027_1473 [Bacteroidia bacterium]